MNKKKKYLYGILMTLIMLFSCGFMAIMGYINFKTNYQDIRDTAYNEIANEFVEKIEVSLSFGKTLENYYGMTEIFE